MDHGERVDEQRIARIGSSGVVKRRECVDARGVCDGVVDNGAVVGGAEEDAVEGGCEVVVRDAERGDAAKGERETDGADRREDLVLRLVEFCPELPVDRIAGRNDVFVGDEAEDEVGLGGGGGCDAEGGSECDCLVLHAFSVMSIAC